MPKIDSQMLQIYQRCTQNNSENGKKISEHEAKILIQRAEEINTTSSNSFHRQSSKGNKYLMRLLNEHQADFSSDSLKMINRYVTSGQMPSSASNAFSSDVPPRPPRTDNVHNHDHSHAHDHGHSHAPASSGSGAGSVSPLPSGVTSGRRHGVSGGDINAGAPVVPAPSSPSSRPSRGTGAPASGSPSRPNAGSGAPEASAPALPNNRPVGGGAVVAPSVPSTPATPTAPSAPVTSAPAPVAPPTVTAPAPGPARPITSTGRAIGTVTAHGTIIVDSQTPHSTWGCHWFPIQERQPGGDPVNNLYAKGGCLDKLDKLTGNGARDYEYTHNRKAMDAGSQYGWWGHCNDAAQTACILQEPKRSVSMTAPDGSTVKFDRSDIQGLLVLMSSSLVERVDFRGQRYNSTRDDPNDPKPELFLKVMGEWSAEGLPFVLDIDRNEQVWNYPYDQVRIAESTKAPEGFNASGLPQDGSVKYYHIEMAGTGFDAKRRVYECYVQRGRNGEAVASGWIKTPNTHNNPDFMWRPHAVGDIMNKATWQLRNKPSNPLIDPQLIYDIYVKSLA